MSDSEASDPFQLSDLSDDENNAFEPFDLDNEDLDLGEAIKDLVNNDDTPRRSQRVKKTSAKLRLQTVAQGKNSSSSLGPAKENTTTQSTDTKAAGTAEEESNGKSLIPTDSKSGKRPLGSDSPNVLQEGDGTENSSTVGNKILTTPSEISKTRKNMTTPLRTPKGSTASSTRRTRSSTIGSHASNTETKCTEKSVGNLSFSQSQKESGDESEAIGEQEVNAEMAVNGEEPMDSGMVVNEEQPVDSEKANAEENPGTPTVNANEEQPVDSEMADAEENSGVSTMEAKEEQPVDSEKANAEKNSGTSTVNAKEEQSVDSEMTNAEDKKMEEQKEPNESDSNASDGEPNQDCSEATPEKRSIEKVSVEENPNDEATPVKGDSQNNHKCGSQQSTSPSIKRKQSPTKIHGDNTDEESPSKKKKESPRSGKGSEKKERQNLPGIKYPAGPAGKVAKYLVNKNRPHSVTELTRAFKDKLSRGQITKALDTLIESNMVVTSHDKKVYWPEQSQLGSPGNLKKFQSDIKSVEEEVQQVQQAVNGAKSEILRLMKAPIDATLDNVIAANLKEQHALKDRVKNAETTSSSKAELGDDLPGDPEVLEDMYHFYKPTWKSLRLNLMEVAEDIMENMAGSKAKKLNFLVEEIGFEMDTVALKDCKFPA